MRIFLAGASGVIGIRLLPLLVTDGHAVAGMTRSPRKVAQLESLGAEPVVCDVYDAETLTAAVGAFGPDTVMDQLTDLPDHASQIPLAARNDRMLSEGTRNLLAAAQAAGAPRILAQSIAWELPGQRGSTYRAHERAVLDAGGVVIRYGQLYARIPTTRPSCRHRRGSTSLRPRGGPCRSSRRRPASSSWSSDGLPGAAIRSGFHQSL
jgi:nucleoside-diphosphate-sugar epimerase